MHCHGAASESQCGAVAMGDLVMMQWSDDVAWRTRGHADGRMDVVFSRRGRDAAIVRVREGWTGDLHAHGQDAWLAWLQRKGFVQPPLQRKMCVEMGASRFEVPCAHDLTLHILAGDEATLANEWRTFCDGLQHDALVAHLRVCPEEAVLSPIACVPEAPALVRRSSSPWVYPAWRATLTAVMPLVQAHLSQAARGATWQQITSRASRFFLRAQIEPGPYRLTSQFHDVPHGVAPGLVFAGARVEGTLASSGVAPTPQAAMRAACGEAWERYALTRDDLAPRVPPQPLDSGIAVHYFAALCGDYPAGWVLARRLCDGAERALPARYVYFAPRDSATNTTGAAYGDTLNDAIEAGRGELIERHALMRAWLGLGRSERVRGPRYPGARYYRVGDEHGLHTVVCLVRRDFAPFCAVGSAARSDLDAAGDKALREALASMVHWSNEVARYGRDGFVRRAHSIEDPDLLTAAMVWPARTDGADVIDTYLTRDALPVGPQLADDKFLFVDVGEGAVNGGAVVKVWHPDALPFPSYARHLRTLSELCALAPSLPLPLA